MCAVNYGVILLSGEILYLKGSTIVFLLVKIICGHFVFEVMPIKWINQSRQTGRGPSDA